MPAPAGVQPGTYEETSATESVKAACLRDIQDCTDRSGKAIWRPGPKDSGLPNIKQKDIVATDPVPDNYAYHARLAVMGAWSQVSRLLVDVLSCLPSTERAYLVL